MQFFNPRATMTIQIVFLEDFAALIKILIQTMVASRVPPTHFDRSAGHVKVLNIANLLLMPRLFAQINNSNDSGTAAEDHLPSFTPAGHARSRLANVCNRYLLPRCAQQVAKVIKQIDKISIVNACIFQNIV